jgi:hypothetical protein
MRSLNAFASPPNPWPSHRVLACLFSLLDSDRSAKAGQAQGSFAQTGPGTVFLLVVSLRKADSMKRVCRGVLLEQFV